MVNNYESAEQPECTVYYLQLFAFSSALALQNYDPACLTVLPWLCNRMPPTLLSQLIAIKTTTGIWNIETLFSCRIAANNFTFKPFTTRYHYIYTQCNISSFEFCNRSWIVAYLRKNEWYLTLNNNNTCLNHFLFLVNNYFEDGSVANFHMTLKM